MGHALGDRSATRPVRSAGDRFVGGLWYGLRLRFCGVSDPDRGTTRRVLVLSWLVVSVPSLGVMIIETGATETPAEAFASTSLAIGTLWLIVLGLLAWSLGISYIATRTIFDARPIPAAIWFIGVPAIWYLLVIGATLAWGTDFDAEASGMAASGMN